MESACHSEGRHVPRRDGSASKGNLPRKSKKRYERVSGRKSSPGGFGELGGDPVRRRPHICSNQDNGTSTPISAPVKSELLV